MGNSNIKSEVRDVSPTLATVWMKHNHSNRRVSKTLVSRYAKDMVNGRWRVTGEPIIFDDENNLLNGQHRLLACIEANTTFRTNVTYNVGSASFAAMDQGKRRSAGDVLSIEGKQHAADLATAARFLARAKRGTLDLTKDTIGNEDILDIVLMYPSLTTSLEYVKSLEASRTILNHGAAAFVHHYLLYNGTEDLEDRRAAVDTFIRSLMTGSQLSGDCPIIALRERLIRSVGARRTDKLQIVEKIAYAVKAWNMWIRSEPMGKHVYVWKTKGRAEKFPVPV